MATLRRLLASSKVRIVLALMWAFLLLSLVPEKAPGSIPAMMIGLGLPLAFGLVPRNWLYGMRAPYTMRGPEEIWYRQNVISGVVLVGIGIVWLTKLAIQG